MVEDENIIEGKILHKRDLGGVIFFEIDTAPQKISALARKDAVEPAVYETIKSLHIDDYCRLETTKEDKDLLIQSVQTHIKKQKDSSWNSHQLDIVRAYAFLLSILRDYFIIKKYTEVRLPSIHYGKSDGDIFQVDFFGETARLTTSNSLFLDIYSVQLQKVFSIQKCFRAEKSHTSRHLAEFDMLEAARLNYTLEDAMAEMQDLIKFVLAMFAKSAFAPLKVFNHEGIREKDFVKVEYEEISKKYHLGQQGLGKYEKEIARDGPVFVINFPHKIASWTAQPLDETYSRSFNLLLPGLGEVAEGTQRQTNAKQFQSILQAAGMEEQLGWYLPLIPYSDFFLSSFGIGIDRLAMWLMGLKNIREIHPIYRDTNFSELKKREKKQEKVEAPLKTVVSLCNMIRNMSRKKLELKRITKTASLLLLSGISRNSIPSDIVEHCIQEQHSDGGWVGTIDTMWNAFFLKNMGEIGDLPTIRKALNFIRLQKNSQGLWGRSQRDMSRIPVTGILFYLFPELADADSLLLLEKLWTSERNSLTYKAGYTLMAFNRCNYQPENKTLIPDTVQWLLQNQKKDGGFSPWRDHPVDSDVFCTSIALLGLCKYPNLVPRETFKRGFEWLQKNRLETGLWKYHEIEDGASWGLYTLTKLLKNNMITNG